jgi:hypothetical protein
MAALLEVEASGLEIILLSGVFVCTIVSADTF